MAPHVSTWCVHVCLEVRCGFMSGEVLMFWNLVDKTPINTLLTHTTLDNHNNIRLHAPRLFLNKRESMLYGGLATTLRSKLLFFRNHNMVILNPWSNYSHAWDKWQVEISKCYEPCIIGFCSFFLTPNLSL